MYDSLNMHSLESSLIDIMRAEQDPMKGNAPYRLSVQRPGGVRGQGDAIAFASTSRGATRCREAREARVVFPTRQLIFSPAESLILVQPPAAHLHDLAALIPALLNLDTAHGAQPRSDAATL